MDIEKQFETLSINSVTERNKIDIFNIDASTFLNTLDDSSVDLILTDPPYIISKPSGMNTLHNKIQENTDKGIEYVKTEEEWLQYKQTLDKPQEELDKDKGQGWSKENYLKYGTILGKKYSTKTDYGKWDKEFTLDELEKIIEKYYLKLKKGGTLIIWFDIWKISQLKKILEKYKFKQIRFIEWIKTNPQPINSTTNYLSNCREIALTAIKDKKPTFNSSYDNGKYDTYPMVAGKGKYKIHPTQKNLQLFEDLIKKHSNENDLVIDTFLGGGTTAIACKNTNRRFKGCEIDKTYFNKVKKFLER